MKNTSSDFVLENIINEERFRLKNGQNTIGRDNVNSIRLQSSLVSRKHCTVNVINDRVFIRDEGSSNGIYINNRQITNRLLLEIRDNDLVGIGAIIEKDNFEDLNNKMVFKLKYMQIKPQFLKEDISPLEVTQTFEVHKDVSKNVITNKIHNIAVDVTNENCVSENIIVNKIQVIEFENIPKNSETVDLTNNSKNNFEENSNTNNLKYDKNIFEEKTMSSANNGDEIELKNSSSNKTNKINDFENIKEVIISKNIQKEMESSTKNLDEHLNVINIISGIEKEILPMIDSDINCTPNTKYEIEDKFQKSKISKIAKNVDSKSKDTYETKSSTKDFECSSEENISKSKKKRKKSEKKSELRRRSKSVFINKETNVLPMDLQNREENGNIRQITLNSGSEITKVTRIKKRRMSDINLKSPDVKYVSPLESPVPLKKNKGPTSNTDNFVFPNINNLTKPLENIYNHYKNVDLKDIEMNLNHEKNALLSPKLEETSTLNDNFNESEDEEFLFSQSIMNKVKDDLAELDNDIICISDDEECNENVCLEVKKTFHNWCETLQKDENVVDKNNKIQENKDTELNSKLKSSETKTSRQLRSREKNEYKKKLSSKTDVKNDKNKSKDSQKQKPPKKALVLETFPIQDNVSNNETKNSEKKSEMRSSGKRTIFIPPDNLQKNKPSKEKRSTRSNTKSFKPENETTKVPQIKKRKNSDTNLQAPCVEYVSPLESPASSKKRKEHLSRTESSRTDFYKPLIPVSTKTLFKNFNKYAHLDKGYELLDMILEWNPEWFKTLCPAINNSMLIPVLNNFDSHEDYKNIFYPLMKEEIWSTMSRNNEVNKFVKADILNIYDNEYLTISCKINSTDGNCITQKDIVVIYVGSKNSNFKMFAQVNYILQTKNKQENNIEFSSKFDKEIFEYIKNGKIKEVYLKNIFSKLDVEAGTYSAIENMKNSPLVQQILNPSKIEIASNDCLKYKYCGITQLNKEQEKLVLEIYAVSLNKNTPSIKLIEGPPGTGKSRLIQNTVIQLLYGKEVKLKPKILICAQSNTAVDIIMQKLIEERKKYGTKLVRYGVDASMHPKVLPFSVNSFVMHEWNTRNKYTLVPDCRLLEKREREILESLQQIKSSSNQLNVQADEIRKLEMDLFKIRNKMSITKEEKFNCTKRFLSHAEVVCTTLPSCVKLFNYTQHFDFCIIDEATQCTEPWSLMPLQFGIKQLVLVGDTQQLPATVTSMKAQEHRFGQSLFSRIQNSLKGSGMMNGRIGKLTMQYRMHPEISSWPNSYFYENCLQNASETMNQSLVFKPFSILNLQYENKQSSNNYVNFNEIEFIHNLVQYMNKKMPMSENSYGIIAPYAKQRDEMIKKFSKLKEKICIDTIDSVQGVERDIVIYSNTRTNGVGFLVNPQRLNVALTRAKKCLIVIGTFKNLLNVPVWKNFISSAKENGRYFPIDHNTIQFGESILKILDR